MKQKYLLPFSFLAVLVLTSCDSFRNDPGDYSIYDPSDSNGSSTPQNISYYAGDTITTGDYAHKETIDCLNENLTTGAYYSESDDVLEAMHQTADEEEIEVPLVASIAQMIYVGSGDGGLLIGHPLESHNGILSFVLKEGVLAKAIKIHARPRANEAINYITSKLELRIDEAALSVNDSDYIKLENDFETLSEVEDTVCSVLLLESGTSTITISCYNMQAIIHTIDIFY